MQKRIKPPDEPMQPSPLDFMEMAANKAADFVDALRITSLVSPFRHETPGMRVIENLAGLMNAVDAWKKAEQAALERDRALMQRPPKRGKKATRPNSPE